MSEDCHDPGDHIIRREGEPVGITCGNKVVAKGKKTPFVIEVDMEEHWSCPLRVSARSRGGAGCTMSHDPCPEEAPPEWCPLWGGVIMRSKEVE